MTAGLETFAKVRALHDRATSAGEKAAAASRMEALAFSAGMTVEEAVSKLDAPALESPAQTTADTFRDFFNTPEMRAARVERERERAAKRAELLPEYGSEDAVFADTPMEAALQAACAPLLGPGETWDTIYHLDGWGGFALPKDMPASVRRAVSEAWPLPASVVEAWAEFEATDKLSDDRSTFNYGYTPHSYVEARGYLVEDLLNTLPARGMNDLRARLSWMERWSRREITPDPAEERVRLATLRADIERMGQRIRDQDAETDDGFSLSHPASVQNGHDQGCAQSADPLRSPDPGTATDAVQSGHPRRTNADKRRDVLALLTIGKSDSDRLSDREIARRAGVSPTTAGAIRRSMR